MYLTFNSGEGYHNRTATDIVLLNIIKRREDMKEQLITEIEQEMLRVIDNAQLKYLEKVLKVALDKYVISKGIAEEDIKDYIELFLSAKRVEGRSEKSLLYYSKTIHKVIDDIGKDARCITTDDLRRYLSDYQASHNSSKVTIDNIRRILSSFFGWLEDEDYIIKSPVRRIHKVKSGSVVKETYTDEELELMRDNCSELRDLALIDMLSSTGMRVGEIVLLNRDDIDFEERECKVFGKGDKERIVYFDARTKMHLSEYLAKRTDSNDALFVSLKTPYSRLSIGGIESRLRILGLRVGIEKVFPHKFRRTLATMAIDKGMPIEQLQRLLGHQRVDTTLMYAMVKQSNVKQAHKKYIS